MKVNPRRQPKEFIPHQGSIGRVIVLVTWTIVGVCTYHILFAYPPSPKSYVDYEKQTGWPIPSYYVLIATVLPTVLWIWAVLAWLGMKFFRNG